MDNDEGLLGRPSEPRRDRLGFRDRTLWDWMELLIVPLFIAGAPCFSVFSSFREKMTV
jgi:hypothetical protein